MRQERQHLSLGQVAVRTSYLTGSKARSFLHSHRKWNDGDGKINIIRLSPPSVDALPPHWAKSHGRPHFHGFKGQKWLIFGSAVPVRIFMKNGTSLTRQAGLPSKTASTYNYYLHTIKLRSGPSAYQRAAIKTPRLVSVVGHYHRL